MTPSRRRLLAGFAILGVVAPLWAAAGVTLHVFLHHHNVSEVDVLSLDALFHGHRHSTQTPDHEHALLAPLARAKMVGPAFSVVTWGSGIPSETMLRWAIVARATSELRRASGAGPPSVISPLRV